MPMPPLRRLAGALALVCALAVPAAPAHALDLATLQTKLQRETAKLGATSGAYVIDLTTRQELFAKRPDLALAPASNEKLFTTATALLRFGPETTLTTTARTTFGTTIDADGVVGGDLYLVGGGDPSLNDVELTALSGAVAGDRGITKITGGVIGDESAFDQLRGSFDSGFKPDSDLGGWLSALTWGHGRAYPGGPAHVAAARLQRFLKADGVKLGHKAKAGRIAQAQPAQGEQVASVASPPMSRLIQITNQPSDNFYAETLVKDLGMHFGTAGTTAAGLGIMRADMKKIGIAPKMVDGSGLSRANRSTARQVVTLLQAMHQSEVAAEFTASLSLPGKVGTLARRMRGTAAVGRCQAKTGTLRGVSALSGYCTSTGGHLLAFSFIENRVYPAGAKQVEDRMVPAIARYDAGSGGL
jgi:D-alanyl-D-alanine carboxypeptidase/D-alanyl-D-alanine-endopeptidase (penicillin-binding protein 4)